MDLFVYGTLLFPDVLAALLDRVPPTRPAVACGWRVAALADRLYPGLVPHPGGIAPGLVLTGLAEDELLLLDAYEDDGYRRALVTLANAPPCPAYVWSGQALPGGWQPDRFVAEHLAGYVRYCARWRAASGWRASGSG